MTVRIYADQIYDYTKEILRNHKESVFYQISMFLGLERNKGISISKWKTPLQALQKLKISQHNTR